MRETDPFAAGSCGRFRATVALSDAIAKRSSGARFTVMSFSDQAKVLIHSVDAKTLGQNLSAAEACISRGQTNYQAALNGASAELGKIKSERVGLYLISDRLPDVFCQKDPEALGLAAADELHAQFPKLLMSAIYVGVPAGNSDPESYLKEIVGPHGSVLLVNQASDLATAIVTIDQPVGLTAADLSLMVTWPTGPVLTVKVKTLTPAPGKPGQWDFASEPFDLSGRVGNPPLVVEWSIP